GDPRIRDRRRASHPGDAGVPQQMACCALMTIEARVRLLEDRDELTRLVANYCKGADSEDAALFASVWHEDAEWDVGSYVFRGRSQILEAVERQWQMFESMHH